MEVISRGAGAAAAVPGLPEGVEAVVRVGDDGLRHVFLLNHTGQDYGDVPAGGVTVRTERP